MIYFQLDFCTNVKKAPLYISTSDSIDTNVSWKSYISSKCNKLILKEYQHYATTSFVQYLHSLFQSRDLIQCNKYELLSHTMTNIYEMCSFIHVDTWKEVNITYSITVHSNQMINFTITKAYVPYSDDCHPHSIALYEGTYNTTVDKLCGVIQMESVYSTYHRIRISLQIGPYHLHTSAHMYASHQVHRQNAVISRKDAEVRLPRSFNVTIGPTSVLSVGNGWKEYVWYLSNTINYPQKYQHGIEVPILHKLKVVLNLLVCASGSASTLSSYHGLLNTYMRKWRVFSYKQYKCNITHAISWETSSHIYTTIALSSLR